MKKRRMHRRPMRRRRARKKSRIKAFFGKLFKNPYFWIALAVSIPIIFILVNFAVYIAKEQKASEEAAFIETIRVEGEEYIKTWLSENRVGAELLNTEVPIDYFYNDTDKDIFRIVAGFYSYNGETYEILYNFYDGRIYTNEGKLENYLTKRINDMNLVEGAELKEILLNVTVPIYAERYMIGRPDKKKMTLNYRDYESYYSNLVPVDATEEELEKIADCFFGDSNRGSIYDHIYAHYSCDSIDGIEDKINYDKMAGTKGVVIYVTSMNSEFRCTYDKDEDSESCFVISGYKDDSYVYKDSVNFYFRDNFAYYYYKDTNKYTYTDSLCDTDSFYANYDEHNKCLEVRYPSDISSCRIYIKDTHGASKAHINHSESTDNYIFSEARSGWYYIEHEYSLNNNHIFNEDDSDSIFIFFET